MKMARKGILKKVDQYLLTNYPVIWRTRIHYILLFSFVFGNIGAYLLGRFYPMSKKQMILDSGVQSLTLGLFIFLFFIFLYWAYTQYKFSFRSYRFKDHLLTLVIYTIGAFSLLSNVYVFNHSIIHTIANVVSDEEFIEDLRSVEDNAIIYRYRYGMDTPLTQEELAPFQAILEKYGVYKEMYHSSPYQNDKRKVKLYSSELNSKFHTLRAAKYYQHAGMQDDNYTKEYEDFGHFYGYKGSFWYMMSGLQEFSWVLIATAPVLLLLLSFVSFKMIFVAMFLQFLLMMGLFGIDEFRLGEVEVLFPMVLAVMFVILLVVRSNRPSFKMLGYLFLMTIPFTVLVLHYNKFHSNIGDLPFTVLLSLFLCLFAFKLLNKRNFQPQKQ